MSVGKIAGQGAGGKSGAGAGAAAQMSAFNQSVSAQVSSAMRLPDRLVQRSQPPSHLAPRRLGRARQILPRHIIGTHNEPSFLDLNGIL